MPSQEWKERPLESLLDGNIRGCDGFSRYIRTADGYAEPGYTDPPSGRVYFSNWNPCAFDKNPHIMSRLAEFIEKIGGGCEWEDEWDFCAACSKAVRTRGDSYHWQPSYVDLDGEHYCLSCFFSNRNVVEDYITYTCVEKGRGITIDDERIEVALRRMHFVKLDLEFENGLYGGQDDDPEKIHEALKAADIPHVQKMESVGQFDQSFSVWVLRGHVRNAKKILKSGAGRADMDPAEVLRINLSKASMQASEAMKEGGGIVVTKVGAAVGDVRTRVVSAEDFIAGRALDD